MPLNALSNSNAATNNTSTWLWFGKFYSSVVSGVPTYLTFFGWFITHIAMAQIAHFRILFLAPHGPSWNEK
jgi:hypothetical protein